MTPKQEEQTAVYRNPTAETEQRCLQQKQLLFCWPKPQLQSPSFSAQEDGWQLGNFREGSQSHQPVGHSLL